VPYLATFVIGVVAFVVGCRLRRRRGKQLDRHFAQKLVYVSGGIGASAGGLVFPSLWFLTFQAICGGPIQDNLPPGFDVGFMLTVLPIGGALMLLHAIFSFIEHLDSA